MYTAPSTWPGLYIGGNFGYGWGRDEDNDVIVSDGVTTKRLDHIHKRSPDGGFGSGLTEPLNPPP